MAAEATIGLRKPSAASGSAAMLYPNAQPRLRRMVRYVARARLIAQLRERGILAVFHYLPLHLSEMGRRYGGRAGDCPVTESVSERLVRLPFYTSLSEEDQERVIEAVRAVR